MPRNGLIATDMQAEFEPACLQKGPQDLAKWMAVIKDASGLLTRISTLAIMMEGNLMSSKLLVESCGFDMLPLFRLVYSQIALACKTLAAAVTAAGTPQVSVLCILLCKHVFLMETQSGTDSHT